jgi:hypothetical protein
LHHWLPRIRSLKTLTLWGNLAEDIGTNNKSTSGQTGHQRQRQQPNPSILRNEAIKAMVDMEDVELIKAVAIPEQVPLGLWPSLLRRLWEAQTKMSTIKSPPHDLVYLMLRGTAHVFAAKREWKNTVAS